MILNEKEKSLCLQKVVNIVLKRFIIHFKPGFATDEVVKRQEIKLRKALENDKQFQVKDGTTLEVAQVRY